MLLMIFFHLEDNFGYIFKKPEVFITKVKIEYQGKLLFPGNSASNVSFDGLYLVET